MSRSNRVTGVKHGEDAVPRRLYDSYSNCSGALCDVILGDSDPMSSVSSTRLVSHYPRSTSVTVLIRPRTGHELNTSEASKPMEQKIQFWKLRVACLVTVPNSDNHNPSQRRQQSKLRSSHGLCPFSLTSSLQTFFGPVFGSLLHSRFSDVGSAVSGSTFLSDVLSCYCRKFHQEQ